jgi:hypothetical protein
MGIKITDIVWIEIFPNLIQVKVITTSLFINFYLDICWLNWIGFDFMLIIIKWEFIKKI